MKPSLSYNFEFADYLNDNYVDMNCLEYWNMNKLRLKNLAQIARKYLCIQATETPCENQFSITGYFDMNYRRRRTAYKKFKYLTYIKLRRRQQN